MMITHRGFSAWIVCGETQETFPEYLVAVDAKAHQVSCWIAGEEGQVSLVLSSPLLRHILNITIDLFAILERPRKQSRHMFVHHP